MSLKNLAVKALFTPVYGGVFATSGWFLGDLQAAVILGVTGVTYWLVWSTYALITEQMDSHRPSMVCA